MLSVNFSADGTQLCSGSADCSCIVWDIGQRKVTRRIKHRAYPDPNPSHYLDPYPYPYP